MKFKKERAFFLGGGGANYFLGELRSPWLTTALSATIKHQVHY